uniref:NAD(P)-dependent oxidoreductase n=1 Tax=Fervidobacterium nodosum TaxID=2424 RepID=A0A7C5YDX0_9BACT
MVVLIGSDGFIGNHVKRWAESLNVKHIGVYFEDAQKGEMSFEEYLKSDVLSKTKTLIITAGNSDHKLPRENFLSALQKDLKYLESLEKSNVSADIVFLSSAAVYYGYKGYVDECTKVEPVDYYGLSKLYSEYMVRFLAKKHDKRLLIFRLTNAFGINQKRKRFFDNILDCLKSQNTFKVIGMGESYMNPLHVEKVGEIIFKSAINIDKIVKKNESEIVNLGSLAPHRVIDIVKYISEKYGLKFEHVGEEEYLVEFITDTKKLVKILDTIAVKIEPLYDDVDRLLQTFLKGEKK